MVQKAAKCRKGCSGALRDCFSFRRRGEKIPYHSSGSITGASKHVDDASIFCVNATFGVLSPVTVCRNCGAEFQWHADQTKGVARCEYCGKEMSFSFGNVGFRRQ